MKETAAFLVVDKGADHDFGNAAFRRIWGLRTAHIRAAPTGIGEVDQCIGSFQLGAQILGEFVECRLARRVCNLFRLVLDAAGGIDCTSKSPGDHFWNQTIANGRSICMA